jgi:hypothetical protein
LWQNIFVEGITPPLSADQLREQLRAESLLAHMEWMEDLAELHDSELNPRLRQGDLQTAIVACSASNRRFG